MPINMNDPYVTNEWIPQSITRIGTALKNHFGQPASSFGARGNQHHASGFHRSESWIRNSVDSLRRDQDYSLRGDLNRSQDANAVSAFDFIPHVWGSATNQERMIQITRRVYKAAQENDPRLANMYEFAGTLNGTTVITFNAQGGATKNPFDSSHLEHVHGSIYRSRQLNDHSGIVSVMLGEGEAMTPQEAAVLQRIDERIGTVIGDYTNAPSLGDTNHVKRRLVEIQNDQDQVLAGISTLVARPAAPPIGLTPEQVSTLASLLAGNLATNTTFLAAVANAVLDEEHRRTEN